MHTITAERTAVACRLLPVLLLLLGCAPALAQPPRTSSTPILPVDSVLSLLETSIRANAVNSLGRKLTYDILSLPASHAARRDTLLDGLERLALVSTSERVRVEATSMIAFAGQQGRTTLPLSNVVPRLLRIYRNQPDVSVRLTIRNRLPLQAERRVAAAFLRTLAAEPDPGNRGMGPHGYFSAGDPRTDALFRLADMGEEGRAVLQAMHRSGEARSPQAKSTLDDMARRGFPVRDANARRP